MESKFAHLRQRDTSVSMLRVKLSRRKSQSQKENRERVVNTRRQLDMVPELDMSSLDASIAVTNMSIIQEKTNAKFAKNAALEERLKQLERWKERKALEREKEKRERENKGVFKTGLYHPKDAFIAFSKSAVPTASTSAKEKKVNIALSETTRVTRSMKQQEQKPLKVQDPNAGAKKVKPAVERSTRTRAASTKPASAPTATKANICAVEPVVRALSTRPANRHPVKAAPMGKDTLKDKAADVRTTRSRALVNPVEPMLKETREQEREKKPCPPSPTPCPEEDMVVDQVTVESAPAVDPAQPLSSLSSFAPEGFVFQAPSGLSSFKFDPLTPRTADAFLTPSSSFSLPPAPDFSDEQQAEPPKPSPPCASPIEAIPVPDSSLEPKHDVPYFRSEIANETDRLTALCVHWESKVEDESIPEEMRDRMRTAVGQARLLMKERFRQFSGLVDDCEFGRGEKITTCTDLQGFWDMVYYQVEDVNKKFDALKEAEARGWVEEHKPPPRQRKVVKKPSAAPAKTAGTNAAAKSRLAAVKAAMKAKQQAAEAEKAAKDAGTTEEDPTLNSQEPQAGAQTLDTVVFNGGFFKVESPAKSPVPVRRSSRLSAAVLPQASPCSTYLSPRRVTRRSLALAHTPVQAHASPARPVHTPTQLCLTLQETPAPKSQHDTHQLSPDRKGTTNISFCFSPVKEVLSVDTQPEANLEQQPESVSTWGDNVSLPELDKSIQLLSTISVVSERDQPVDVDLPLSPCKKPASVSQSPEASSALSFMLSTPSQSSTVISSCAVLGPVGTQESVCHTPDSSFVEEVPGLDFERYFHPSKKCSLSPRETVAAETLSPMAVDAEMESPRSKPEYLLTQREPALPGVSSMLTLQSPQVQTPDSALLLFTPDLKDRIRQSVCPSDLMVFTPPSDM
ncbi:disks large-associated protein 5 [Parambassis ranga]|uniref:Disks large-associated protein 5 n=1 Tax=Parambassis ranga TaxID=210632 RepID=A0A6P7KEB2_9TELE|nr:disks large-associated protein 5 [Parambassis ranga]